MNNTDKRWHRQWKLDMTAEEVQEIVDKTDLSAFNYSSTMRGPYTPEDSDALVGCRISFAAEGHVLVWNVLEKNRLQLTEDGLSYDPAYCQVLTMDGIIFLVHHLIPEAVPLRCVDLIVDMSTGNATAVLSRIGTQWSARDVDREFLFGRIDGNFPEEGPLHDFTSEMVGKAIVWTYREGSYEIRHIYSTNYYYTYTMNVPQGTWVASNPADYVKIKDHTYIFSFVEERQPGLQALFVMDLEKMRDIGATFGIVDTPEGGRLANSCVGAKGREMPMWQIFER